MRKRYAIVGTGGRGTMYLEAIAGPYRESGELAGLCDISQTRMDCYNRLLSARYGLAALPTYPAEQFERMLAETRPDCVIVTSVDSTHDRYIIAALRAGCDVITEKPMTTTLEKTRAILAAAEQSGRQIRVTFNYRYMPIATKVRELVLSGVIGQPLHINFMWALDVRHGADYFRRWHAEKDKSGGLLVHKATHHFDLVNWWIGAYPQRVMAMGGLLFYGRANAEARGERYSYARYTGAAEAKDDPFALDLNWEEYLTELYLKAEADSGYIRDRNVFGDHISIEDTMQALVAYRNGVMLSYSLIAYCPWEGFRVAITGTKGRIEVDEIEGGTTFIAGKEETLRLAAINPMVSMSRIRVFPMWGIPYDVAYETVEGGHGGGDDLLLEQLFSPAPPHDQYQRAASHIDGAASILVGIAANESMQSGRSVNIDDLISL